MLITDLPDEDIIHISRFLDGFSLVSFTQTCSRFQKLFTNNVAARNTTFSPVHGKLFPMFNDVFKYLIKNRNFVTYLDFSYVTWINQNYLAGFVKNLVHLKYLNIVGTNIFAPILPTKNKSCFRQLLFTRKITECTYVLRDIDYIVIVNNYHKPVSKMTLTIENNVNKVLMSVFKFYPGTLMNIYTVDKNIAPEVSIKLKFSYWHEFIQSQFYYPNLLARIEVDNSETEFYIIESLSTIYVSSRIYPEISSIPCAVEKKMMSEFSQDYIVNIHVFTISPNDKLTVPISRARSIIETRSTKYISLFGKNNCPNNGFNILPYLAKFSNIQHLSIQPCSLAFKTTREERFQGLFKKQRLSKIPSVPEENCDYLKEIGRTHKNITVLQIKLMVRDHHCSISKLTCNHWAISTSCLESIAEFKNLKYLVLWRMPYFSMNTFAKIFENCTLLQSLSLVTDFAESIIIENLPKSFHLAKKLQTLEIKVAVRNINIFINSASYCPSLLVMDMFYASPDVKEDKLITMDTIQNLLVNCPNLHHMTLVENNVLLSERQRRKLRRLEKDVKRNHPTMLVNFSNRVEYMKDSFNDIGEFLMD